MVASALWFGCSHERVLQRDTNVGTGTPAPLAHASRIYQTRAPFRCRFRGRMRRHSLLQCVAPDGFPVLAAEIGDAAVALVEFVRDLEHREHQPTFGRP